MWIEALSRSASPPVAPHSIIKCCAKWNDRLNKKNKPFSLDVEAFCWVLDVLVAPKSVDAAELLDL